jgi:hypothetical protein
MHSSVQSLMLIRQGGKEPDIIRSVPLHIRKIIRKRIIYIRILIICIYIYSKK